MMLLDVREGVDVCGLSLGVGEGRGGEGGGGSLPVMTVAGEMSMIIKHTHTNGTTTIAHTT